MNRKPENARILLLLEMERLETLALAAQARYVGALLTDPDDQGHALAPLGDLGERLQHRAQQLEILQRALLRARCMFREDPSPSSAPDDADDLYWPLSNLVESYRLRSSALEGAVDEARALHEIEVEEVLQDQLERTEDDLRVLAQGVLN